MNTIRNYLDNMFLGLPDTEVNRGCPYDCGICPDHRQHICCVLLEITNRCNLHCPICFASSGKLNEKDPSLEDIEQWYKLLKEAVRRPAK
jgi:uncharacterized radical SAM superfamily Fe-S cluster-containing enzyme